MPWYRTPNGTGVMHLRFGPRQAPKPCRAARLPLDVEKHGRFCGRVSVARCAAAAHREIDGEPLVCGMPVCGLHVTLSADGPRAYCPRHAGLAIAPPRPPASTSE